MGIWIPSKIIKMNGQVPENKKATPQSLTISVLLQVQAKQQADLSLCTIHVYNVKQNTEHVFGNK